MYIRDDKDTCMRQELGYNESQKVYFINDKRKVKRRK